MLHVDQAIGHLWRQLATERILKIGQYLVKVWTIVGGLLFLARHVRMILLLLLLLLLL